MMCNVPPRAPERVVLLELPGEEAPGARDRPAAGRRTVAKIVPAQLEEFRKRPLLDQQRAVHVGFTE